MKIHRRSHKTGKASRSVRKAYLRGKLLERRRKLLERLRAEMDSSVETSGQPLTDVSDMASAHMDQETSFSIGSVESRTVSEIDRALERLEEGTYGVCENCGARIPASRLRALPFASRCVTCQNEEERYESSSAERSENWASLDSFPADGDWPAHGSVRSIRGRTTY